MLDLDQVVNREWMAGAAELGDGERTQEKHHHCHPNREFRLDHEPPQKLGEAGCNIRLANSSVMLLQKSEVEPKSKPGQKWTDGVRRVLVDGADSLNF